MRQGDSKILWESREPRIAKAILKNMVMELTLSNIKKGTQDLNRHCLEEDMQMTSEHMKRP